MVLQRACQLIFFLAFEILTLSSAHAIPGWETNIHNQTGQFSFYCSVPFGGEFGLPVGAADWDNDGTPDLVVTPMNVSNDDANHPRYKAGEAYVLRGNPERLWGVEARDDYTPETFPGLTILGARSGDFFGVEMFSADVNGDEVPDMIIGAQTYDGPLGDRQNCGGAFIILGAEGILSDGSVLNLDFDPASPPPGLITVYGERAGDRLGLWVEAGDFDGDGMADLALGGDQSVGIDPENPKKSVGMAAILYGRKNFPALIDLAEGPENIPDSAFFYGVDASDHFGTNLHGADFDNDGQDELIVSSAMNRASASWGGSAHGGGGGLSNNLSLAGEVVIVFSDGKNGRFSGRIDLATIPPELQHRVTFLYGGTINETMGEELASGDFDGNGTPELCLGGLTAHGLAGVAYVLYGVENLKGDSLELRDADRDNIVDVVPEGMVIRRYVGSIPGELFGDTMVSGDFNWDGFEDLTIGIPHTTFVSAGVDLILFGGPEPFGIHDSPHIDNPEGSNTLARALIQGPDPGDNFGYSLDVVDWDGDGYTDIVSNAMKGDGILNSPTLTRDAGEVHVISGYHATGTELTIGSLDPAIVLPTSPAESINVTLRGTGFTLDTRVLLDNAEVPIVEIVNGRELVTTFPGRATTGSAKVTVSTGHATLVDGAFFEYQRAFVRGDSDNSGDVDFNDAIQTLVYLLLTGVTDCVDAHDFNDSGKVDFSDALDNMRWQFLGTVPPPSEPYPEPGLDPTPDLLGCTREPRSE